MRALFVVLGLALLGLPTAATAASVCAAGEPRINLELRQTPLRQAIAALFSGSTQQFVVDPDVRDVPVTLKVTDVSLAGGLRLILKEAAAQLPGLTSSRDGAIYLVKMRSTRPAPITPSLPAEIRGREVTFNLREVPLRSALDVLFTATGVVPEVGARVPDVPITLGLRGISLQQALRLVLRQAAISAPGITGTARDSRLYVSFVPNRPQFTAE